MPTLPALPTPPTHPTHPEPPLIDFQDISLRRSGRTILDGISWRVERGESWAVVGANGSGKTTLLRIAAGMLFPSAGTASVLGCRFGATDLAALRRRIGWVSSATGEFIPPGQTAAEIVAGGLVGAFAPIRPATPAELATAQGLLARAGMGGRSDAPFGVLSAGERQKVLLARAMAAGSAAGPELLILDEAAAGLDLAAREEFLASVISATQESATGLVIVTHHIEEIPSSVTHSLVLREGRVLAAGATEGVLTGEVLTEAFGIGVSVRREGGRFHAALATE